MQTPRRYVPPIDGAPRRLAPDSESHGAADPSLRRLAEGPAPRHSRGKRAVRSPIPRSSWALNGVAIAIAVLLAPALTASSATTAVPSSAPSAQSTPTALGWVATDPRFSPAPGQQPALDRSAERDDADADADDTLPAPSPSTSVASNGSDFVSPVPGAVTGGFGMRFHPILHYSRMHNGVDMHAACGTPVVAAYRGTVVQAGPSGGYGNLVVIDLGEYQGKHTLTKYAHLSRIGVRVGQQVTTGQGIALAGTTGLSTGCHLHFEIKVEGSYVDPSPYLTGKPSPRPSVTIENLGPTASPTPTASATRSSRPTPSPSTTTKGPKPSTTPTKTATPSPSPPQTETPTPTPTPTETATETASATASEHTPKPSESVSAASDDASPSDTASP